MKGFSYFIEKIEIWVSLLQLSNAFQQFTEMTSSINVPDIPFFVQTTTSSDALDSMKGPQTTA